MKIKFCAKFTFHLGGGGEGFGKLMVLIRKYFE